MSSPIIPGHETIGTVAAIASGEKKWKVGDRVGGTWHGGHDGIFSAQRILTGSADLRSKVPAKLAIVACSKCATIKQSTVYIETVDVRQAMSLPASWSPRTC